MFVQIFKSWASLVAQLVKNLPAMWETWVGKIPWRIPTPVFWPGEFHGLYIVHGITKSQIRLNDFHFLFPYQNNNEDSQASSVTSNVLEDTNVL